MERVKEKLALLAPLPPLLAAFGLSILVSFSLRFNLEIPSLRDPDLTFVLLAWPVTKLLIYYTGGFGHGWWRQVSLSDVLKLVKVNLLASIAVTLLTIFVGPAGFPRSVYLIDLLVCTALTCGLRVCRRAIWEIRQRGKRSSERIRTAIYGAGDAGISLVRELRQNPGLPYEPIGFIDDDRAKRGSSVLGVKVLGTGDQLAGVARRHGIAKLLVAIPSATGPQMTAILRKCRDAGVEFKTVPSLGEVLERDALARQIRDVRIEDLLGREPVRLDTEAIHARLAGKRVLITGSGGSIGSEMCRQIAIHEPSAMVGLDAAETPLFHIDREMRERFPALRFSPELGSVCDAQRLEEVLAAYHPEVVIHAAAYKHVPLTEIHPFEAIANNVFGTATLVEACVRSGVQMFTMISTDKAVRPTNIMGATKRVAEMIVSARARAGGAGTKFVAVRFGNVLGSNGSVVPIFIDQIRRGGPVTVTHPEIRRFFMTIPEAAQLVLQAAALSQAADRGGEVFVLAMGAPVKIADLARNLILLSGLRPDEDIRIEFTGLRPGEKLYEELSFLDEETLPTAHERVRCYTGAAITEEQMELHLQRLHDACRARDLRGVIFELKEMVPDYNPSSCILRKMIGDDSNTGASPAARSAMGAGA